MGLPRELIRGEGGKIVLLVVDGLGGLPDPSTGRTELESAHTPHLDELAGCSSAGRLRILDRGVTPGSGPGHLSLFGYDPTTIDLGRGLLEALGSDHDLGPKEIAARGNFCTLDSAGTVTDRRAGRPSDEKCRELCARVQSEVSLSGAELLLLPGREHRFTLVLSGEGLGAHVNDNDPQREGRAPLPVEARDEGSRRTAAVVGELLQAVRELLRGEPAANGMLLRGFSARPEIEPYGERFALRAAAVAIYPMYRGVARLVGMEVLDPGRHLDDQIETVRRHWDRFDFFFVHTKAADQAGHGGQFAEKIAFFEELDARIPGFLSLDADVFIVTGDHSTPCLLREHSWHPVPVLLRSPYCLPVSGCTFSERGVLGGDLGETPAQELIPLALAHAGRLDKYGA